MMKENAEEENCMKENSETSLCLSKEAHVIEQEFIQKYKQLPVLWDAKHEDYSNKYRRTVANDELLKILRKWDNKATRVTVRQKINVLRSMYRKELRKHLASKTIGPDGEEIYEYNPKNWKFYALRFIGGKEDEDTEHIKKYNIVEINLNSTSFEDADAEDIEDDDSTHANDVIETYSDDDTKKHCHTNMERKKRKRVKLEVQDYFEDNIMLDREFEAIGSNVVCKLRRMNAEQRCHAELLINKVLIQGLKNNLTDDTDLTEVYK